MLAWSLDQLDRGKGAKAHSSQRKALGTVTIHIQRAADGFINRVDAEKSSGSLDLDERARPICEHEPVPTGNITSEW